MILKYNVLIKSPLKIKIYFKINLVFESYTNKIISLNTKNYICEQLHDFYIYVKFNYCVPHAVISSQTQINCSVI